jgi:glyoxylase I family protein
MKFEHFALNVPDVLAHARWWTEHVGFRIVWRKEEAPFTHFLGDDTGRVVLELYSNPAVPRWPLAELPALSFHVAVVAADARAERRRLETAGATFQSEDVFPDGTCLVMLRDPWGVSLQLCQRARPFA